MRSRGAKNPKLPFDTVFGFARSVAEGRAFIARKNGGELGSNFVGYERSLPQVSGMVLLDATADIDGVSAPGGNTRPHQPPSMTVSKSSMCPLSHEGR